MSPCETERADAGRLFRPPGYAVAAIVGESHFLPDVEGIARVGLDPDSQIGTSVRKVAEPWDRDDQLHPDASPDLDFKYNEYLAEGRATLDAKSLARVCELSRRIGRYGSFSG